jgi:Plasmid pRiA4b ORF-3-like protein
LSVSLRDVVPRVLRVVDVPASVTLPELHDVLQAALGWTDSHLHQFVLEPEEAIRSRARHQAPAEGEMTTIYAPASEDGFESEVPWVRELDEAGVRLRDLPQTFVYAYDLGDGWEHDVQVLGAGGDRPGLVFGEGDCPPEDCGGSGGYEMLLAAAAGQAPADADPGWVEQLRSAASEIRRFDTARVDDVVRRTVGVVPGSVRLLLDLCADGVKLTPGGRLPRSVVRAVQDQRPSWNPWGKPASVEEDLLALCGLHDVLRQVGLLRLSKGVVKPVKAVFGPDGDVEVVRRLRSWLPPGRFMHLLVSEVLGTLAAEGPAPMPVLAEKACELFRFGWSGPDGPVTAKDIAAALRDVQWELAGLDLIDADGVWAAQIWKPGPASTSLLPRAVLLADFMARVGGGGQESGDERLVP